MARIKEEDIDMALFVLVFDAFIAQEELWLKLKGASGLQETFEI